MAGAGGDLEKQAEKTFMWKRGTLRVFNTKCFAELGLEPRTPDLIQHSCYATWTLMNQELKLLKKLVGVGGNQIIVSNLTSVLLL